MNTYRISEKEIKDMQPVAVGYKMFNNGFTTKHGDYDYKDENGNVVGTIHKVDGKISECNWGLHFSKLPHDCFNFYEPVQWNKFAKVEAYGELIEGDKKCVASILKIVEVYSFDEFIDLCKEELQKVNTVGGSDIRGGYDIYGGYDIWGAYKCEGISRCIFCYNTTGKLMAFNKPISQSRFEQLWQELNNFDWYPKFNNAEQLKGNLEWYETNIPAIVGVDRKTAWSSIPQEMKEYIQNLPEYDEKIFNIVTGIAEEEEDER